MKRKFINFKVLLVSFILFTTLDLYSQTITCFNTAPILRAEISNVVTYNGSRYGFGIKCKSLVQTTTIASDHRWSISGPSGFFSYITGDYEVTFDITDIGYGTYEIYHGYQGYNDSNCSITIQDPTPIVSTHPMLSVNSLARSIDTALEIGKIQGGGSVSPTGGANYTIPISLPSGTNEMNPTLSMIYNSSVGGGSFGQGWGISGLSEIIRVGNTLADGVDNVEAAKGSLNNFSLDGNRLIEVSRVGNNKIIYASRNESFSTITLNLGASGEADNFIVETKSGMTFKYGYTLNSKYGTTNSIGQPNFIIWKLEQTVDPFGNYIQYEYRNFGRELLIHKISYTGNGGNIPTIPYNFIEFKYERKQDISIKKYAGGEIKNAHVITQISITAENSIYSKYYFKYGSDGLHTFLNEVVLEGSDAKKTNSTLFKYGDLPSIIFSQGNGVPINITQQDNTDMIVGDFNGDGISDVVTAPYTLRKNGDKLHTTFEIYNSDTQGNLTLKESVPINSTMNGVVPDSKTGFNFLANDFNGDGLDDIVRSNTATVSISGGFNGIVLRSIDVYLSDKGHFTTRPDQYKPLTNFNIVLGAIQGGGVTINNPNIRYLLNGDYNGDSQMDYLTILSDHSGFKTFLNLPALNLLNQEVQHGRMKMFATHLINADKLIPLDFDGDGKTDLMTIDKSGCYVYSIRKEGTDFIAETIYSSSSFPNKNYPLYLADFNADGKTDLLLKETYGWYVYYSTGANDSFKDKVSVPLDKNWGLDLFKQIQLGDFDGNGYIDIIYLDGNSLNNSTKLFVCLNNGSGFIRKDFDYSAGAARSTAFIGDFNGDGKSEVISQVSTHGSNAFQGTHVYSFYVDKTNYLLETALDGFNRKTTFTYYSTGKKSNLYTKGTSRIFPLVSLTAPMLLLSQMKQTTDGTNYILTDFKYEDAALHRTGLGFLGFNKIRTKTTLNGTTNELSRSESTVDIKIDPTGLLYFPFLKKTISAVGTNITETTNEVELSETKNGCWWLKPIQTTTEDNYTGITTTQNFIRYSANGDLEEDIVSNGVETVKSTNFYTNFGTPARALPTTSTVEKTRIGESAFTTTTKRDYYPNGNLKYERLLDNTSMWTQTDFSTPNRFGLSEIKTITGAGVTARSSKLIYSANGRFVVESKNVLDQSEKLEDYDVKWGKPKKVTSIGGMVSLSKFDGFGRTIETSVELKAPLQTRTATITYAWETPTVALPARYSITTVTPDKPTVKEYFDILERSIRREVTGFKKIATDPDVIMVSTTKYNAKGLVEETTAAHKSTTAAGDIVTTTTAYDILNRVRSISVSGISGTTSVVYAPNKTTKEMSIETTSPVGKKSTQITDASGKVVKTIDDGGHLLYYYKSHGAQYKVVNDAGQVLTQTITFDDAGRATKTRELNSGDSDYSFNAYGEMLTSKIANAVSATIMTYTTLGQPKTRKGPEGNTEWIYYPSGSGAKTNAVETITGFSGGTQSYIYDDDGRPLTYTETVMKPSATTPKTFVTKYTYHTSGNVKTLEYPDGLKLQHSYNSAGYLLKIEDVTNVNASFKVYENDEKNAWGRTSKYTLGNNITTQKTFDKYGYLRQIQAGNIQNMSFNFNINTGNLDSRSDNTNGRTLTENFGYDADGLKLDRLTSITGPSGLMSMVYDKNGNIKSKTGLQDYTYHQTKIHAVTRVENYPTDLNRGKQDVEYTPFHNAKVIKEKFSQNGANWTERIEISYGADYERTYAKFVANSRHDDYEIYYQGKYEELIIGGVTKKIHYIYGGDGLCAMAVDEGQGQGNQYHYVYKDYLGSILTLTSATGTIEAEQSFDAWGRRRFANTWVAVPSNAMVNIPIWLYRGFTGHEHYDRLVGIHLINMNARLYDPVNARFLRWDIATSGGTQGMNRYSYALNNPLKYTDPTGNFVDPVTSAVIGAAVGVVVNGLGNLQQGKGFWEGAGQAAISGALSGFLSNIIGIAAGGYSGVGKFAFQTLAHAGSAAMVAGASGQDARAAAISSGISSIVAAGVGRIGAGEKAMPFLVILSGGVSGGISAEMAGGKFWSGFGQGVMTSALNHVAHMAASEILEDRGGPGHEFKTIRAAARDWAERYNGISIAMERELRSPIFQNENGTFSYYEVLIGDNHSSYIPEKVSRMKEYVADIHSHGKYESNYDNDRFSTILGDIMGYEADGRIGYVSTPNGSLLEYNPNTNKTILIGKSSPSDPIHPLRLNSIPITPSFINLGMTQFMPYISKN